MIWNNTGENPRGCRKQGAWGGDAVSGRALGLLVGQLWGVLGGGCRVNHELGCHPEPSGLLELLWKHLDMGAAPQRRGHGSWGTMEQSEKTLEQCLPQWPWGGQDGNRAARELGMALKPAGTQHKAGRDIFSGLVQCSSSCLTAALPTSVPCRKVRLSEQTGLLRVNLPRLHPGLCGGEGSPGLVCLPQAGNPGESLRLSRLSLPVCYT